MNKIKSIIIALAILFTAALVALICGCSATPAEWESKFYTITTNTTPTVVWTTNVVQRTNITERVVMTTNQIGNSIQITMTPTKETIVFTEPVVTVRTNVDVTYTYTANTNAALVSQTAGAIAAPFGLGGIVSTAIAGLFGLWASVRSRKTAQVAAGLTQGIEVASEILRTTPQGSVLDEKLKGWLQQHQVETGTISSVLTLLNTVVDNEEARAIAAKIQAEIAARSVPKT